MTVAIARALRRCAIAADAAYLPDPAAHPWWSELRAGPHVVFGAEGQAWGFVAAADDAVWAAFRGSASVADWVANLGVAFRPARGGAGRVHAGIGNLAARLAEPLRSALAACGAGDRPVRLVGHSLGGAVAKLLLVEGDAPNAAEAVVFGAPRVLDRTAREGWRAARIVRVANEGDPVPHLPPALPFGNGYAHFGESWRLDERGGLQRGEPAWGPWVAELSLLLFRGSAEERRAALARRLDDHRTGAYLSRLAAAAR